MFVLDGGGIFEIRVRSGKEIRKQEVRRGWKYSLYYNDS